MGLGCDPPPLPLDDEELAVEVGAGVEAAAVGSAAEPEFGFDISVGVAAEPVALSTLETI
jgi:hypothetical protein